MQINKSSVIKLIVVCLTISLCHAHYFCDQLEAVPNCSCNDTSYESELSCLADPDIVLRLDDEILQITCEAPKELKLEIFPRTSNIEAESLQLVNCSLSKNTTFEHILQHFDVKNTNSLVHEGGDIGSLSVGSLSGLSHFETVNIINSSITALHEDSFNEMRNMTKLDLSFNKLKYLPVDVFSSVQNLEVLFLSENKLKRLSAGTFRNQGKLESLCLSQNRLKTLVNGTFHGLLSLKYLEITHNKLTTLANGVFDDIAALTHLDLSSNRLTSLSNTVFEKLNNLEELQIDDNKLASIHANAFVNNVNLRDIRLCKNRLSFGVDVSNSPFRNLNELWSLYLDENSITTILSDWRNLKELSILSLKHNTIESLNYENLSFRGKEVYVDLEGNNIKDLQVPHDAEYVNSIEVYITKIDCCLSDLSRLSSTFSTEDLHCTAPQSMLARNVADIKPLSSVCDVKECPSNCTCSQRKIDNTLMLNCSEANLQLLPRFSNSGNYSQFELHINRTQETELPNWLRDLVQKIRLLD